MSILRLTPEQYAEKMKKVHAPAASPRNKWRNRPTGGYSSAKEARRAAELKLMASAGLITELEEQVPYELIPPQYVNKKCVERACSYIADFRYKEKGEVVVEDVKSEPTKTAEYVIKRKLMLSVHGIRIKET